MPVAGMQGVAELRGSGQLAQIYDDELSNEAQRVYECLVHNPDGLDVDDLARRVGLDNAEVERAAAELGALGLVNQAGRGPSVLRAISPESARSKVLGPIIRELDRKRSQVDELRDTYADLVRVYHASPLHHSTRKSIEILHDSETVNAITSELAADAQSEIVTSQLEGAGNEELLTESLTLTKNSRARRLRVRMLCPHTARYSPTAVYYARHATHLGAEVRTSGDGLMRLTVFDDDVAVIGLRTNPHGAAIVRESHLVHFISSAFERAWVQAEIFDPAYHHKELRGIADDIDATIVRLLVDGVEDKIIARRLGMSLRTLQRHISEIMKKIGARNRLHAGYLIYQHGLVERAPSAS